MLDFHAPVIDDMPWVKACLAADPHRACEFNFTNILGWSGPYDQRITQKDGFLLTRLHGPLCGGCLWPVGGQDLKGAIEALWQDANERGCPLRMVALEQKDVDKLEALFPGRFTITSDRNGFDYCYDIDKMCELSGKKLHGKRNHINRFLENNEGNWTFAPMTKRDLAECLEMDAEWRRQSLIREGKEEAQDLGAETKALLAAAAHFETLGMDGGVLRVYGEVVAFTLGDLICQDTYDVHFEKAYGELQGAYPMVAREFARLVRERHPNVRYLNREDDMGVEGLRKAKESYYPDLMVEKFSAVEKR